VSRRDSADSANDARSSAALEDLEATYRHAPVGLCVLDRALRYVRINDRLAEINGLPVEAHIGRTTREIVPALADAIDAIAEQVFGTGRPVCDVEVVGATAADPGSERVFVEQWYPLLDAHGEVTGLSVVVNDVTAERAAKREAQAARAALEQGLHETTALMAASRELSQAFRLDDVLRTLCRVARELVRADGSVVVFADGEQVHYAEEDAIGPLWKGQRFRADMCVSGWAIATRKTVVIEDIYAHPHVPHDAYRPTFVRGLALAPVRRDEPLGALGVYWRETYRPTEEQVRLLETLTDIGAIAVQNAQLFAESEDANRRKDEFLAMLAHELRNPLAPVMNAVELLRALGPREDRLEQAHEVIHRQVRHMSRLIDDLLDVSRITRGRIDLRKERLGLGEIVAAAVEASRHLFEKQAHTLTMQVEDGIDVDGDRARLVQVVTNLLMNAAKFTPDGGQVTLRAGHHGSTAVIAVRDTGIGIAREAQHRIFELFAREDVTVERAQRGLGIGLTLAKRLVEMHGGSLSVKSEGAGTGTEFVIMLPGLTGDRPAKPAEAPVAPATSDPLRILVVEDNDDAAESFKTLLELRGHTVEVARDGHQALRAIPAFAPHVAFVDIGLPGIDGFEVAERVRSQGGERPVLIALSGYGREEDKQRAAQVGFDAHMTKPADLDQIQALLARCGTAALPEEGSGAVH
jgi:PAS domain S-box-containing protein